MTAKKYFIKMVPSLLLLFILSCSHFTPKVIETPLFREWASNNSTSKIIAILPFSNETKAEGVDQLVREGFYKHFSVRNFFDIEIVETDDIIKSLEGTEGKDFHIIPPEKLGEFLHCDALVYGKVTRFKRIFLLLYVQTLIEAEVRIVDTHSGNELWKHSFTKRFHEGGVPTGPFGVIPAAIRTTYSLRESKRNGDIETFCKDFVSRIPEIQHLHAGTTNELCAVQVASFKEEERALALSSDLNQHGYKPLVRKVHTNDETWYRVTVGPFVSREDAADYQVKLQSEYNSLTPLVVRGESNDTPGSEKDTGELCEVRIASFTMEEGASTISSELSQRGYKPFLTTATSNGEIWHNVLLGPYTTRREAEHHQVKLKREFSFLDPIVAKSKNGHNATIKKNTIESCEVKVASFTMEEGASTISSELSQRGYKPFLTTANSNGGIWYNVMLGPFASRKEAVQQQVKLKKQFSFLDPIVLKDEGRNKGGF